MQFVSAYRSGKPVIKSICGFPRCVSELLTPPQSAKPGLSPVPAHDVGCDFLLQSVIVQHKG